jgi:hypothetical protein
MTETPRFSSGRCTWCMVDYDTLLICEINSQPLYLCIGCIYSRLPEEQQRAIDQMLLDRFLEELNS